MKTSPCRLGDKKHSIMGNTNPSCRFEKAAMAPAKCITRNRVPAKKGGIPVLVEGKRDEGKLSGPLDSRVLSRR
ncbi:MAG: hypothetical protein CM15mP6_3110 [Methanobacteriota archaeon]|nr:MAG: hypothetical protein CM15mP6_3110 [Euryarchaeota archaeon]